MIGKGIEAKNAPNFPCWKGNCEAWNITKRI